MDPDVTGPPVTSFEAIRLIRRGYFEGALYAFTLVAIVAAVILRSGRGTLLALAPLVLSVLWALGLMHVFHLRFNMANVWAVPLIIGVAAEFGLNIYVRFMEARDTGGPALARSTVMGVLLNGLTTMVGFASLMIARHQGIFGLGLLLTIGAGVSLIAALTVLPVLIELFGAPRRDLGRCPRTRPTRNRSWPEPTMLILADFLDSLLHGAVLVSLCLTLGSVVWGLWVLRGAPARIPGVVRARCLRLLELGAVSLALGQLVLLALKALMLSDMLGSGALVGFARTEYCAAGVVRAALALGLAAVARSLGRAPGASARWAMAVLIAVALAGSSAWLTHATGRLTYRAPLMALTVLHQVGAAVWLGGLIQLAALGRLARRHAEVDALCARAGRALLPAGDGVRGRGGGGRGAPGVDLYRKPAGPRRHRLRLPRGHQDHPARDGPRAGVVQSLNGPQYAAVRSNVRAPSAAAAARRGGSDHPRHDRLRGLLPVGTAAGHRPAGQASRHPRRGRGGLPPQAAVPQRTPSVETMRRNRMEAAARGERSPDAYRWSNFTHNVAGLILLGMSLLALAGFATGGGWGRHWPLGFVALAAFNYLRVAANEGAWPFGATPLGAIDAEGIQHRIAAALVLGIGLLEWRARTNPDPRGRLAYVFPVLCAAGGVLLLAHSHAAFELKSSFLVQVTHTTIGAFAGLMVAGRWLELGLAPPWNRVAGAAASASMLAIAAHPRLLPGGERGASSGLNAIPPDPAEYSHPSRHALRLAP